MFLKRKKSPVKKDLVLVKRFLKGEKTAQSTLHTLVDTLLEKALAKLATKGCVFQDPENTKQEILVGILTANNAAVFRNFKGQSLLSTYLWSIIRFKLIDKLRQEKLAAERTRPLPAILSYEARDDKFEIVELVHRFIERSTEKEAFILEKRWLEELDYQSINKLGKRNGLQISLSDIGNTLYKKRRELIRYLKKHDYVIDKRKEGY